MPPKPKKLPLRGGHTTSDGRLDRLPPTDWKHVEKYGLTAEAELSEPTPLVLACNWYSNFDNPTEERDSGAGRIRYWIGRGNLGRVRGGHAIAIKSGKSDRERWYAYYDQGEEGACVGYSCSRMMTMGTTALYDARWLYNEAQRIDEWPGEGYDGTSLRAALEVVRTRGHKRIRLAGTDPVQTYSEAISVYRWATTVEEVHQAMRLALADRLGAVPLLNSWGPAFPHVVWLPDEVLARLISEEGEVGLVTKS